MKTAKTFGLPIVHSTVNVASGQGKPTVPELAELLEDSPPIDRTSINSWEDVDIRCRPACHRASLDAFGTLVFQVTGQQLSVSATRTILSRLQQRLGGRLPSPAELLAADPEVLRASGLSARKGATLRALAERFVDGRLSDEALSRMTDDEVEAALTEVPGIGPWTAHGDHIGALR